MTNPAAPKAQRRARAQRRKRVPSILQFEAVECGAASLAMVLAYHGAWVPLERLRAACGVSRDGSKASNVLKAARSFGLNAKGYKKEPADLKDLPWPLIIHWNFNHFLVLEGITDKVAHINDPASGPRTVTLAAFNEAFTGVAMAFERTEAFAPTAPPPGLWSAFVGRVAQSRASVGLIALLSVLIVVPGVVLPVFSKLFLDDVILKRQEDWAVPLFLMFAFTALVRAALTAFRQSQLLKLESKLAIVGASRFIWRVLQLPMGFFSQRSAGEVAGRIDASQRVAKFLSGDLAANLIDCVTVAAFALIMVGYDAPLGLAAVALAVPNFLLLRWVQEGTSRTANSVASELGKLGSATAGLILNIETIKASGLEEGSFGQWAGRHARSLEASRRLGAYKAAVSSAPTLLANLTQVLVLGLGAFRVLNGAITLGDLAAFQTLAASFTEPLHRIVALGPALNAARADLKRVDDAQRNAVDPMAGAPDTEAGALSGALTLSALTFGYNPLDRPLVEDVGLTVSPGQRVALVGRSGCGKSTLGKLLCGLLKPWSGTIAVDGIDLADIGPRRRAANIAYVDQDVFLFEGTVRENLTLWNPDVPDSVISQALDDAALLDEIVSRPGELDAYVDEGGRNFSGGQRQRLEIARALVGDPSLLILDEATAALDAQTEKLIDDNLRRRGCTCVIIAHRLSTVRDCSDIAVMRSGRVVERGTHDELVRLGGEYAELIRAG